MQFYYFVFTPVPSEQIEFLCPSLLVCFYVMTNTAIYLNELR